MWRSFCACRRGEGEAVAAAMANGGDGCARGSQGREGKREPKEGERSRGRGENEGRLWVSPWRRKDVGEASTAKQEVARSAACEVSPSAYWQRLKTVGLLVGLASWLGYQVGCAAVGPGKL